MIDEDTLIERLTTLKADPRAQRRECELALRDSEPVARKARWAYSHYLRRAGRDPDVPIEFVRKYLASWRDSILHVVNGRSRLDVDVPSELSRTLFACWHFPEHPVLLGTAADTNTLVLVASERAWMEDLRRKDCLYCFRGATSLSSALPRAFARGRPIFAMLDFCYESSHHVVSDFLSYPSRTPTGVLELAARYGYRICVVSIRGRRLQVVEEIPAGGLPVEQLVDWVNQRIEREILRRPERWLLWPAVPQRWIGVDYDTD